MTAQEYIQSTLEELAKPIEQQDIGSKTLEDAIYAKVMSKKFRKLKADDDAVNITKRAIKHAIDNNAPLAFNVVFGGNKLWTLDEAPEIDWAELFATTYFLKWLKTIASVYEYGAKLEFYSEDVVLEVMNNLPKSETDQYSEGFKNMLNWLEQYIPDGISVSYRRYGEDYESYDHFLTELEEAKKKVSDELKGMLPSLDDAQKYATELNVRPSPGQTDDPLWREKVELIHQSIERTETIERYFDDPQYVPVCPIYFPGCITTGSTKKSLAKFWVGIGALQKIKNTHEYREIILTPKQLENSSFEWEDTAIKGLIGRNLSKIRVIQ